MHLTWTDEMSVGSEKLDAEHKKFLDLLNRLHADIKQGTSKDQLATRMRAFKVFISEHFISEEELMNNTAYGEIKEHVSVHNYFLDGFKSMLIDYEHEAISAMKILDFICEWFLMHFSKYDKKLGVYLLGIKI